MLLRNAVILRVLIMCIAPKFYLQNFYYDSSVGSWKVCGQFFFQKKMDG